MDTVNLKNCLNDKIQALQEPETRSISMNQTTEIATIPDSKYPALTNNALDIISEKYNVRFILSISKDEHNLPECAKAKVIISL